MLPLTKATSLTGEHVFVGPSLVIGITGQPSQIGVQMFPSGASMVIGGYATAATFFASQSNYSDWIVVGNQVNPLPMAGTFYVGSGNGATLSLSVVRFFKD